MEPLEKAFYEERFKNEFLQAKGEAFQIFFNDLMSRAYKKDYMPCQPWGNQGDRKNDGYLKSERCLFQVYAPNEMKEKIAIDKIQQDFEGAKKFWGEHFNKWAFVHNAYNGIPPHVQKVILDFEKANSGIKLETWSLQELLTVFRRISREDIESWLGYAPNAQAKIRMGFEDIRVVLENIASRESDQKNLIRNVPPQKIEANQLSDNIAKMIKEGISKASLIEDFFNKWPDATFGENIAVSFRKKYDSLRGTRTSNEIFYEIQTWVGGSARGTAEHEMAILSVIAYYFERCDIFEEPRR